MNGRPPAPPTAAERGFALDAMLTVCLIGAGPRGLSVLERVCANARATGVAVEVHVVDPYPPGAGRVWRSAQTRHLLMNTVADQISVFTDDSVEMDGPLEPGPTLWEWSRSELLADSPDSYDDETRAEARDLGPDTYPTRAFYGHYLEWAFRRVVSRAEGVSVLVHRTSAVALEDGGSDGGGPDRGGPDRGGRADRSPADAGGADGARSARAPADPSPGDGTPAPRQSVLLADGTQLDDLDAVVLAQGHLPVRLAAGEQALADAAARHGLIYLPPANPAELDLTGIPAGEPAVLRGLGLSFFDLMALLTVGRGGTFDRVGRELVYHPSGLEPRLYAGSRRGIPYQARGENEKGRDGRHRPLLLTPARIAALRERAADGTGVGFRADVWPLVAREVETVYYCALLGTCGADVDRLRHDLLAVPPEAELTGVLDCWGVAVGDRWDWQRVALPYAGTPFAGSAAFTDWVVEHLRADVREARAGNVNGPLKAALDVLRDLRNEIRLVVDHGGLDGRSHHEDLDRWYTPLNAHLSIGPPVRRVEEMIALLRAGVLHVIGPRLSVGVDPEAGAFVAESPVVPGSRVRATVLVEARIPEISLSRTADPLLRGLLGTGRCRPHRIRNRDGSWHISDGLAVTERPYRLIDARGRAHPHRFAFGVPTEAVHWATAAGIRPGVNSVTLADSDAIARAALRCARPAGISQRPAVPV